MRLTTKNWFRAKKVAFLDPKRATLGNRGHETGRQPAKRPPTGKLKVSRVTSGYGGLMIPLRRVRPTQKKWALYRHSVKKCRFSGQNRAPAAAPRPAVQRDQHKNVVFLLSGHDGNKIVGRFWQKNGFWAKKVHFRPKILHFFTLHL